MRKQILLLVAGVLLYTLAFPPVDLGFLGFVALVPFVLARQGATGWKAMALYYAAAVALFVIGCHWLAESAPFNLVAMALPAGLYFVLFALLYGANRARGFLPVWSAVPLAWVVTEYVRTCFPLDGFPWLLIGYAAWRIPPLLQTADLFGVWGPGLLMALCSGVVAQAILQKRGRIEAGRGWRSVPAGAVLFGMLMVSALAYGFIRPGSIDVKPGPVLAAVQGNIPQSLKGDRYRIDEIIGIYRDATEKALDAHGSPPPDMIVWPETVCLHTLSDDREGRVWFPANGTGDREARILEKRKLIDPVIRPLAGARGAWFLTGALTYRLGEDGEMERRNSVILYDPDGRRRSRYSKTILVPGGEYLPWIDYVPFRKSIEDAVRGMAGFLPDLSPGDGPRLHTIGAGEREVRFGVQICYENIYAEYCSRFVDRGAEFMINISNEGWFRESVEFDQMMAMSLFRAVETRRSLFRCTNTGISCLIDPLGTPPGEGEKVTWKGRDRAVSGVLIHEVPLCDTATAYTALGDLLPRMLGVLQIFVIIAVLFRARRVTKKD